jgi:hypothetical protein
MMIAAGAASLSPRLRSARARSVVFTGPPDRFRLAGAVVVAVI